MVIMNIVRQQNILKHVTLQLYKRSIQILTIVSFVHKFRCYCVF